MASLIITPLLEHSRTDILCCFLLTFAESLNRSRALAAAMAQAAVAPAHAPATFSPMASVMGTCLRLRALLCSALCLFRRVQTIYCKGSELTHVCWRRRGPSRQGTSRNLCSDCTASRCAALMLDPAEVHLPTAVSTQ